MYRNSTRAIKKDGVLDQLQTAGSIADVAGGIGSLAGMFQVH